MKKAVVEDNIRMSLVTVGQGKSVKIVDVHGGHGIKRRLAAMGLVRGQEIEVIHNHRGSPLVISVLGSRFMVGRGMAHKIIVS
jgi:Fe2+ transport system protein FeoA